MLDRHQDGGAVSAGCVLLCYCAEDVFVMLCVCSNQVGQALSLNNPNPTAWQQAAAAGSAGQLLPPDFNPAGEGKRVFGGGDACFYLCFWGQGAGNSG
jgi:hypothetical protein